MLNKKLLTAAVTTALMAGFGSTQVLAADDFEISGNIALTSDYRFRGISQSNEDPAVQGGFDVGFEPGFYLGTWASSIDFGDSDNDTGSYGTLEVDYYGGWRGPIGDSDFGIDVGYAYYTTRATPLTPRATIRSFTSRDPGRPWFWVWPTRTIITLRRVSSGISPVTTATASWIDLTLGLHAGYNRFRRMTRMPCSCSNDKDDYTDYSVSLTYNWAGVDFSWRTWAPTWMKKTTSAPSWLNR